MKRHLYVYIVCRQLYSNCTQLHTIVHDCTQLYMTAQLYTDQTKLHYPQCTQLCRTHTVLEDQFFSNVVHSPSYVWWLPLHHV